jgi:hypothetical protein
MHPHHGFVFFGRHAISPLGTKKGLALLDQKDRYATVLHPPIHIPSEIGRNVEPSPKIFCPVEKRS